MTWLFILIGAASAAAIAALKKGGNQKDRAAVALVWYVNHREFGGSMLLLTNNQKVTLSIKPVDAYGNPARVDGVPEWTTSDATIGTLEVAGNGLAAVFTTTGPVGLTQVNVTADADLGAGVRTLSAALDINVESGEAVALSIIAGQPEPR